MKKNIVYAGRYFSPTKSRLSFMYYDLSDSPKFENPLLYKKRLKGFEQVGNTLTVEADENWAVSNAILLETISSIVDEETLIGWGLRDRAHLVEYETKIREKRLSEDTVIAPIVEQLKWTMKERNWTVSDRRAFIAWLMGELL